MSGLLPLVLLLAGGGVQHAAAQSDRPAREARSENRRFILRIESPRGGRDADREHGRRGPGEAAAGAPHDARGDDADPAGQTPAGDAPADPDDAEDTLDGARIDDGADGAPTDASRQCWATLLDGRAGRRGPAVVWRAPLVNDYAPVFAFVDNEGMNVVTLDEYRRGGAAHAVVIYGPDGQVEREFALDELLDSEDLKHVKHRGQAVEWLRRSRCKFVDDPPAFAIRLEWGRTIWISLEDFELLDPDAMRDESGWPDEPPVAEADPDRADGAPAFLAEMLELLAAADPTLEGGVTAQELLEQAQLQAHGDDAMLDDVRDVLLDRIEQAMQSAAADEAGDADASLAEEAPTGMPAGDEEPADPEVLDAFGTPVPPESSWPTGPQVDDPAVVLDAPVPPAPSLDQPVDYASWLMEQTNAPDDPVVQHLRDVVTLTPQGLELDPDLYAAAMSGDPVALADPRVQDWLAAHEPARQAFRAATFEEYHGWPMVQPGDMLISGLLPQLAPARMAAKVSVLSGKSLEAEGRYAEAADAYLDVMRGGAQFGQGVTLIESLVGTAMGRLSSDALLDLMARDDGGQLDYASLAARIDQDSRPVRPLSEMLQFERAMYLDMAQRSFVRSPDTGFVHVSSEVTSMVGMASGSEELSPLALTLQLQAVGFEGTVDSGNAVYDRMTQAVRGTYGQSVAGLGAIEQELATFDLTRSPLVHVLVPSISRAHVSQSDGEAARRATRLVAQLQSIRQQTGTFPDSLDQLGGSAYAIDPFSGQPFRYERTADGFRLYSVGSNAQDDGGVAGSGIDTGDRVYWPRPQKP